MADLDTQNDLHVFCEKVAPKVDAPVTVSSMAHVDETSPVPEDATQTENGTEEGEATMKLEAVAPVDETKLQPAPVVFMDPSGRNWTFPFGSCRTWDSMEKLINKVLVQSDLPKLHTDQADSANQLPSIDVIKPEKRTVPTEFWEQVVQPGWEITVRLPEHQLNLEDDVCGNTEGEDTESIVTTSESPSNSKKASIQDISYTVELYQQDGSTYPSFLGTEGYHKHEAHRFHHRPDQGSMVLQEVRRLFLGLSKHHTILNSSLESRDYLDNEDIWGGCLLRIHSPMLLNALKAVIQFQNPVGEVEDKFRVRSETQTNLDCGTFVYPFQDLYYYKDELLEYKKGTSESRAKHPEEYNLECDEHIDILVKYLYDQPSIRLRDAESMWKRQVPMTDFSSMWLLLKPGTMVYVPERGVVNAYIIDAISGGPRGSGIDAKSEMYTVQVWNLDFDGKALRRSARKIPVPVFDGERAINSLPLYPERFHEDREGEQPLRELLAERGRKFVEVIKSPMFQEYTGPGQFHGSRVYDHTRVIVDHTSQPWVYEIDNTQPNLHIPGSDITESLGSGIRVPGCHCAPCESSRAETPEYQPVAFADYDDINLKVTDLSEKQYILCWSHVYGYALQDRLWDMFQVDGLMSPRIDKNIIDTLVMKPKTKEMVKAICETYGDNKERENLFFADFIRGKGEGQIMLLHGPPGTGKTLTAESVAEYIQRPLLSITAADLGHEPEVLEKNLLRFFRNASKWDAIVLLDEADVYLERRSAHDLRRNGIVSVFLRALDYFQGILFLTTNRVGSFDEAFMSRIHLQIGYEPLDDEARLMIWNNSFKKLQSNHKQGGREISYSMNAKEFVKSSKPLQELQWNGREIRNAFQTAVALAAFEAKQSGQSIPNITEEHISQVVDMSVTFKRYMKDTLQANDAEIAFRDRLRNDRFKLVPMGGSKEGL